MTCRCGEPASHYIGGGQWVCFRHWLIAALPVRRARRERGEG
jgi:hypothetical protein